jgi:menaquinol-cytochrome c reductase cytochrome b subunit
VHVRAGDLLLLAVVVHVAAAYFRRAYERPREYQWLLGALVLPAVVAFRFTGTVLPWDAAGWEATRKGLELLEAVPLLGRFTATWLRGGEEMGPNTLSRFFTTHTLILPWLLLGLLSAHLYLVRRYGMKGDGR